MRSFFSFKNLTRVAVLTAIWCILWRDVSVANIISGLLVGAVASSFGTKAVGGERINLLVLLRLIEVILVDLVVSTFDVIRSVIKGASKEDEIIIDVKLPVASRPHLFLIVTAITVTPGTAVVDIDQNNSIIFVHLLDQANKDGVREHIGKLSEIVCRALPTPSEEFEGAAK